MKKILILALILTSFNSIAQKLDIVGGYFPYWRSTNNINFDHYNYLYYAFIFPTPSGGIEYSSSRNANFNSFQLATKNVKAKKFISIGSTGMKIMSKDPNSRLKFADTLRKFCRINKFQGIDMDWESIDNATDRSNFTALMKDIRNTIDSTNLEFSITVGFGNYWLQWYENEALLQADFLQIMIYDQTGTWVGSPYENHSSMEHFTQAETYWLGRGFTKDKLVMGLPYYGYKFKDDKGGIAEAVTYADILKQFPNMKASDNNLIDVTGYYWFNGVDLIKEKINYCIDKQYKGVFVWEIAQDNTNHLLSLEEALYKTTSQINNFSTLEFNNEIKLIQNNSNDKLQITGLHPEFIDSEISIYNFNGSLINRIKITESNINTLYIDELKSNLYLISILKNNQLIYYQKVKIK